MIDFTGVREFIQEHPGCSWEDACDWYEQTHDLIAVPSHQWVMFEEVWEEESKSWEPNDDEMMASFGTKWHDGL